MQHSHKNLPMVYNGDRQLLDILNHAYDGVTTL